MHARCFGEHCAKLCAKKQVHANLLIQIWHEMCCIVRRIRSVLIVAGDALAAMTSATPCWHKCWCCSCIEKAQCWIQVKIWSLWYKVEIFLQEDECLEVEVSRQSKVTHLAGVITIAPLHTEAVHSVHTLIFDCNYKQCTLQCLTIIKSIL